MNGTHSMNKPIKPLAPCNTMLYCSLLSINCPHVMVPDSQMFQTKEIPKFSILTQINLSFLYFLSKYVILITFRINQFQICQYHFPRKTEKLRNSAVQRNVSLYAAVFVRNFRTSNPSPNLQYNHHSGKSIAIFAVT